MQMTFQATTLNVPYARHKPHFHVFASAPDTQKVLAPTIRRDAVIPEKMLMLQCQAIRCMDRKRHKPGLGIINLMED